MEKVVLKIDIGAVRKYMVSMAAINVILENWGVPTTSVISQLLLILDFFNLKTKLSLDTGFYPIVN